MKLLETLFGARGAGHADAAYRDNCRETVEARRLVRRLKLIEEGLLHGSGEREQRENGIRLTGKTT